MLMPARVALALQADGWWLRSEIIWHKPNPMPESCQDRPTSAHEKMFLLSKSTKYFYDADAVRVTVTGARTVEERIELTTRRASTRGGKPTSSCATTKARPQTSATSGRSQPKASVRLTSPHSPRSW